MADTNWVNNATEEDGNLYAAAEARGASVFVLSSRARIITFLKTKSDMDAAGNYKRLYYSIKLYINQRCN